MQSNETMMDLAAEIRDAIKDLTKEVCEVRIALNAMTELFEDVVDQSSGQYPAYLRVRLEQ